MAEQGVPNEEAKTTQKRFYRIPSNKMIGGVCAGISNYFGIDVNLIRIVWVVSVLLDVFSIFLYVLAWIIIPEDRGQLPAKQTPPEAKHNTNLVWGAILIVVGILFLGHGWDFHFGRFGLYDMFRIVDFDFGVLIALGLIAIGVYYLLEMRKSSESAENTSKGEKAMEKKLTRSKSEKMIAGVCGGLAEYFNVDPSFVRIGFAIAAFIHFLGVIVYIVMAVVVPESNGPVVESKTPNKS